MGLLSLAIVAGLVWGSWRWQRNTETLRARLVAAQRPVLPARLDAAELQGLPAPVQVYLQAVLEPGQPMIAGAHFQHTGTFNMGESQPKWRPFSSEQQVCTQRPGFDWNGRISIAPELGVWVHDAYVGGEGLLHASLLGVITLADVRGTAEVAQGELMRYLAEAAWYPTALLPSQGVRWQAVDAHSAQATLVDGSTSVSATFGFDAAGLIHSVHAAARARTVAGQTVMTPWQGRFWAYVERGGMQVPSEGEVAWLLPSGPCAYWRGRLVAVDYQLVP